MKKALIPAACLLLYPLLPLQTGEENQPPQRNLPNSLSRKNQADPSYKNAISLLRRKIDSTLRGSSKSVVSYELIHDFAGNEYLYATLENSGYGVVNLAANDVTELAPFADAPFSQNASEKLYVPWVGFFERNNGRVIDCLTREVVMSQKVEQLQNESQRYFEKVFEDKEKAIGKEPQNRSYVYPTNYPLQNGMIYADFEVPYSWFFKRNLTSFPQNQNNYCGYVAASFALMYNEVFQSAGYFSTSEASTYITRYVGNRVVVNNEIQWDGVPDLSDSFPTNIWGASIGPSVPGDIDSAIHDFMQGKGKNYSNYLFYAVFANVTDPVHDGFPSLYFGNMNTINLEDPSRIISHVVTVYGGWDDDLDGVGDLLCHFGWEGFSQVRMSQLGILDMGGVVACYNHSPHVHASYFQETSTGLLFCGCGELMTC